MVLANYKELDKVGRIVISKDIRKSMDINSGDKLSVESDEGCIVIKKVHPACAVCGGGEELTDIADKKICRDCIDKIKAL